MKNLKKVLALVLVVATLMGFATVASAADFTDAKSIEHKEAVDVMKMIGVVNGLPNGSFNPNGTLDRAQMATMVALILNKGESVSKTYAGANSFTDCVGHWASGAIALASSQGIISGVGNGKFNPDGPVTGAQASRMLVSALGYDTKTEGIGGAQWATRAVATAKKAGLLDGLDTMNVNATLTRDQACQMMFNALKADMVQYDRKADSIDLSGIGSINLSGSSAEAVKSNDKVKYDNVADEKVQLCEDYFPDLKLESDNDSDNYGRNGHTWTYKKDSVGPYVDEADITYTALKKWEDIKKDLEKADFEVAAAGADPVAVQEYPTASNTIAVASANAETVAKAIDDFTGNGKIVEIYLNDDGTLKSVVAIAPQVGEVKVTEVKATNSRGAYTRYTIGGVSGQVFSTVVDEDKDVDTAVLSGDIQDGDLVTYYQGSEASNKTAYIFATTEVSGLFTRANSGKTELTLAGTKYETAADRSQLTSDKLKPDSKNEKTFVLDSYGYVVDITGESTETLYGMVLDDAHYDELKDGKVEHVYAAMIATASGTVETIKVSKVAGTKVTADTAISNLKGKVIKYEIDEDDLYDITDITGAAYVSAITKIEKGETAMTGSGNAKIASGSTLFVIANYDNDKSPVEVKDTVTTYTGYKNVPDYGDPTALTQAYAIDTDDTTDKIANVVFVYDNVDSSSTNDWVYVSGYFEINEDGNREYVAVLDGKQDVLVVKDETNSNKLDTAGLYTKIAINGKTVQSEPLVAATAVAGATAIKNAGDVLVFTGSSTTYKVTDDVPVYKIDTTDEENPLIEAITVADLGVNKDEAASSIYVNHDDGTATAIYLLYAN